jgi:hypothetical protein
MEKDYVDKLEDKFVIMYANKYSLEQLEDIKQELIYKNELDSVKIIDKAIDYKLQNELEKEKEDLEYKKKLKKVRRYAFLSGLFGGLISGKNMSNDLSSWEKQELINNELDEHNFEEEIEDEDDFYSDDLD